MPRTSFKKTSAAATPAAEVTPVANAVEAEALPPINDTPVEEGTELIPYSPIAPTMGTVTGYLNETSYVAPYLQLVAKNSAKAEEDATLIGKFSLEGINLSDKINVIPLALVSYFEESIPFGVKTDPGRRALIWSTQAEAAKAGFISSAGQDIQNAKLKLYNNVAKALLAVDVTGVEGNEIAPIVVKDSSTKEKRYIVANFKVMRTSVSPFVQGILNSYNTVLKRDLFAGVFQIQTIKKVRDKISWYVPQSRLMAKTDVEVYKQLVSMFKGVELDPKKE